jgi:peptidoglycan hydrolase-like protein with peptidoglycan-binding domain
MVGIFSYCDSLYSGLMLMIKRGMVGAQVRDLQIALNVITGAGLKVDGIFGPRTEEAVRTFQTMFNLTADGIVGKKTGTCLVAAAFCRNQVRSKMARHY